MLKKSLIGSLIMSLVCSLTVPLAAQAEDAADGDVEIIYEQSFESEALPESWAVTDGKSTVASELPAGGVTAKKGERVLRAGNNASIEKIFSGDESLSNAVISVWIYDDLSDTATAVLQLSGGTTDLLFGLYQAKCANYTYRFGGSSAAWQNTKIPREKGWHEFIVDCTTDGKAVLKIDNNEIAELSISGDYSKIGLGTLWYGCNKNNNTVYMDALSVTRVSVPENLLYRQSFESESLPAGWAAQSGKAALSNVAPSGTVSAKDGAKALKFAANAVVEKSFVGEESIDFAVISLWIYDDMSSDAAAPIALSGDSDTLMFGIYQARCANNYTYRFGGSSAAWQNTKIARSEGWHEFKIDLSNTGKAVLSIDGAETATIGNVGVYNKIAIGAPWYSCNSDNSIYADYLTVEKDKTSEPNPDVESWHFFSSLGPWKNADTNTSAPTAANSILSMDIINQSSKAGITADVTLYPQQASVIQINVDPGSSEKMKLTYTTRYSSTDLRDTTIWFDVTPNEFNTYTFLMSNLETWTNTVTKLTFGFPEAKAGETVKVDWIKAMNEQLIHKLPDYTEFTPEELPVERDFRVAYHFSDNMVLQRGKPVHIWGVALEGETVTVSFNGQTKTAAAGSDRKWHVTLDAMSAAEGSVMTISGSMGGENDPHYTELKNVCVGEVWVLCGQSNTNTNMTASSATSNADAAAADYPDIRYARIRTTTSPSRLVSNTAALDNVEWEPADEPGAVTPMSGVAFYYAKNLYEKLHVPIGIISAGVSATNIEAWLPKEELANVYTPEELELRASLKGTLTNFTSAFYNGNIYPIAPMSVRGFIWYQGESSAETELQATHHYAGLRSLITSYRRLFGDDEMPFLIVQLPGYNGYTDPYWAYIREAQMTASQNIGNVGLAVTADTNETNNLHPANKDLVGERLCGEAMRVVYGESARLAVPMYKSMRIEGSSIIVTFNNTGTGLSCPSGETLKEFEICGADGVLYPAEAAIISANEVRVTSASVPEPKNVYYGFHNKIVCNLFNSSGIQASPFRTDMPVMLTEDGVAVTCRIIGEPAVNVQNGAVTCEAELEVDNPGADITVIMAVYKGERFICANVQRDFEYTSGGRRRYAFEQAADAGAENVTVKLMVMNNTKNLMPLTPVKVLGTE